MVAALRGQLHVRLSLSASNLTAFQLSSLSFVASSQQHYHNYYVCLHIRSTRYQQPVVARMCPPHCSSPSGLHCPVLQSITAVHSQLLLC